MRATLFALALGILAWAAIVVPLPLLALEPVPAMPIENVIELGQTTDQLEEDLLFTAVLVQPVSAAGTIETWIDPFSELTFAPRVVPQGVDQDEFIELQRRLFEESVRAAAAVGLRQAGLDVSVTGSGARVEAVLPGSPADDVLRQGDVIVGLDGEDISLASEVAAVTSVAEPGTQLEVTVERGDRTLTETVTVRSLEQTGQPGIGVLARTLDLDIDLPVEVRPVEASGVGGPSAGLMMALAVYDAATEGELADGRIVAGSGTIDLEGNVGIVSGITEKVRGAVLADADVFLVPEELEQEARDAAPNTLEVIAVGSIEDAIEALE